MSQEQSSTTNSIELKLTPEGEAAALTVSTCDHAEQGHTCGPEYDSDKPVKSAPLQLTKKQLGQLRRAHITVVHGTVKACGHSAKFGPSKQPTNNCVDCWVAFFATHVDLLAVHKLLSEQGVRGLEKKYGTKFMRNFHGFLALYLKEQKEAEEPQEAVLI